MIESDGNSNINIIHLSVSLIAYLGKILSSFN